MHVQTKFKSNIYWHEGTPAMASSINQPPVVVVVVVVGTSSSLNVIVILKTPRASLGNVYVGEELL